MAEGHAPDVVLVEDDPGDIELILRALRDGEPGLRVHVARDGKEAIDLLLGQDPTGAPLLRESPGLVLLDFKLPRMSGIEVLKRIKGDERTKGLPVIIFSSSREKADVMECYRYGANAFVQKPSDFEEFREAIRCLKSFWLTLNEPPPKELFVG